MIGAGDLGMAAVLSIMAKVNISNFHQKFTLNRLGDDFFSTKYQIMVFSFSFSAFNYICE